MPLGVEPSQQISIHALREEGDRGPDLIALANERFLSTPSARRATQCRKWSPGPRLFLSTPSARRATLSRYETIIDKDDFYPRPPRGGRRKIWQFVAKSFQISIHALREEGDPRHRADRHGSDRISIHALREEGDAPKQRQREPLKRFLSTPSARRATAWAR